jgi:integrase
LLDAVDRSTPLGSWNYALLILMLLIRTGIRRAEAAALTLGDFGVEQGHNVLADYPAR